jgi:hypothetical protein
MPEPLRLSAEALHDASSRMLDLMDMSRREHSSHDDDIVDAAGRWNGEIANALAHVAGTWADKRAALHTRVGKIGIALSDAAANYSTTDNSGADAIKKSTESL